MTRPSLLDIMHWENNVHDISISLFVFLLLKPDVFTVHILLLVCHYMLNKTNNTQPYNPFTREMNPSRPYARFYITAWCYREPSSVVIDNPPRRPRPLISSALPAPSEHDGLQRSLTLGLLPVWPPSSLPTQHIMTLDLLLFLFFF